jgi:hypothetical protein
VGMGYLHRQFEQDQPFSSPSSQINERSILPRPYRYDETATTSLAPQPTLAQ